MEVEVCSVCCLGRDELSERKVTKFFALLFVLYKK